MKWEAYAIPVGQHPGRPAPYDFVSRVMRVWSRKLSPTSGAQPGSAIIESMDRVDSPDTPTDHAGFPDEDSLCERCGYPLRGIALQASCPECGSAVSDSSPDRRSGMMASEPFTITGYARTVYSVLTRPRNTYLMMSVVGGNRRPRLVLIATCFLASLIYVAVGLAAQALAGQPLSRLFQTGPAGHHLYLIPIALALLTYVEVLGVTAFSGRKGWRVPMRLAERVCCYAAVAWLPGMAAGWAGFWWLHFNAAGEPWFERLLGLVRIGWMVYGGLFVLSLLWFESVVWLGARQVRYANRPSAADIAGGESADESLLA